jgi:hypothetical protein
VKPLYTALTIHLPLLCDPRFSLLFPEPSEVGVIPPEYRSHASFTGSAHSPAEERRGGGSSWAATPVDLWTNEQVRFIMDQLNNFDQLWTNKQV